MPVNVLVATPHAAFGSLLKISLLDSGSYQIKIAQSAQAARELFSAPDSQLFDLVIFDSALSDEPFTTLCHDLLERQPGVRLIVIPPENNPNHPSLGGLMPHAYLNRPFYLPDLLDTVQRLLAGNPKASTGQNEAKEPAPAADEPAAADPVPGGAGEQEKPQPPASTPIASTPLWLQDADVLREYLVKELAKTHALAALVGVYGPEPGKARLIGQAGSLSEEYVQALAEVTFRYWNDREKTDLMRYIRIPQDRNDFLVYATRITGGRAVGDNLVLVLVNDNSTPVSLIRPQTRGIAQSLASLPPDNFTPPGMQPVGQPADDKKDEALPASKDLRTQPLDAETPATNGQMPYAWLSYGDAPSKMGGMTLPQGNTQTNEPNGNREIQPDIDLSAILGAIPSPNPEADSLPGNGWALDRFAGRETPTMPGGGPLTGKPGDWGRTPSQLFPESEPQADKRYTEPLDASRLSPEPSNKVKEGGIEGPTSWLKSPDMAAPVDQESPEDQATPDELSGPHTIVDPPDLFDLPDLYEAQDLTELKDQTSQEEAQPEGNGAIEATRPVETAGGHVEEPTSSRRLSAATEVKTEPPITPAAIATSVDANVFPAEPPPGPEDTQPSVINTLTRLDQLEPVSPAISLLKYTCVILPRLPQHYLTGELAEKLALWLPQACLAYGWRLEGIAIRPEYLQWTVQVVPAISPGNLVRILRQRISYQIFSAFPRLAEQNPSGDFWALGYLIVSGGQPPSAQLLRDYIAQTRKRQGVVRS